MCVEYEHEQFDLFDGEPMSGPLLQGGDTWPGYVAAIVANVMPREWLPAMFGLMPHWAKPDLFRNTYNAAKRWRRSRASATRGNSGSSR